MKVTILGGGHIGGACALGLAKSGVDVTVTARSEATLSRYAGTGIRAMKDNAEAVRGADIVVIAVKTAQAEGLAREIRASLEPWQTVACMAAQVTPEQLEAWLAREGSGCPGIAYVIPNTAVEIAAGFTFIADVSAGEKAVSALKELFSLLGECMVVDYAMLPAGISVASCGIAYAFKYISASVRGAEELGFTREEAMKAVCGTVLGAVRLVSAHGEDPELEVRRVATPGGLTEQGVRAMDAAGFDKAVADGLKAWL